VPDSLLDELCSWLRIPSISSGDGQPADLERAAGWVCERIEEAGGTAAIVPTEGNPLAVGELRSARADAPTVLIYGHYDVQSPSPESEWLSPPFEPEVRDGRVYARGASDDKGNFLPLLHVACRLARAGELPVHVRVVVEGEEEIGGHHVLD
jgi:acetylornithine deacetylase/succinyl-diaminopimelate desuccinylase-like protein